MSPHVGSNNSLLPPDSVRLGRLVCNATAPNHHFLDPLENRPTQQDFTTTHQNNFQASRKSSTSTKLQSCLYNAFSASCERKNSSTSHLAAPKVSISKLDNSKDWFKSACKIEETRRWLEDAFDNSYDVYLVVGIRILEDATLRKGAASATITKAIAEAPVNCLGLVVPHATDVATPGAGAIPGVGVTINVGNEETCSFEAPGRYIFGVEYLKLKFRLFSSRKVKNTFLEKCPRWKTYWDWRGAKEEDEDEEDMMEVDLEELSDLEAEDEDEHVGEDETSYPREMSLDDEQDDGAPSVGKRKRAQEDTDITPKRLKCE